MSEKKIRCNECNKVKPEGEFYKHSSSRTGRQCKCIPCYKKRYYPKPKNPEYLYIGREKEYRKEYQSNPTEEQKQKHKETMKKWVKANKERLKEYHREYQKQRRARLKNESR